MICSRFWLIWEDFWSLDIDFSRGICKSTPKSSPDSKIREFIKLTTLSNVGEGRSALQGLSCDHLELAFPWMSGLGKGKVLPFLTLQLSEGNYGKALRYTTSTYTDFTDTQFLIGSKNIQVTLILSLFFTDTRFFTSGKIKIIEFSLLKSDFVHK